MTRLLTRDKSFYRTLGRLMLAIVLQNVVAYSVNMADNLMLGTYSQIALSGAATVNQIQFLVQQMTLAIGDSLVAISTQYWATRRTEPICRLTGLALGAAGIFSVLVFAAVSLLPHGILSLFTADAEILASGAVYLDLIRYTYPLFILSTVLMSCLRSVETVGVSFAISVVSLVVNCAINYTLIFGRLGFPEMGIRRAPVGTLVASALLLLSVLAYILFRDRKLRLFASNPFRGCLKYRMDYWKLLWRSLVSYTLWALATPIQAGILGRLSADAIAANSVSTTLFQYLKVVTRGEASASAVLIGRTVGENNFGKLREYCRTLQALYLGAGLLLSVALFFIRVPLLSLYVLNDSAREMANQILILLCFVFAGMAYQMPCASGIVRGGGDVNYTLYLNVISTWGIVMPLSFAAAFRWQLLFVAVVFFLNCDQIFKCLPTAIRVNRYKWVRHLTRD
ncbi:MAG: MATE family efflux transporter [Oscillospiraceae bacterium]|nr:MATE family efflux transporter [Oscillospiraceae bacterium]